MKLFCLLLLVTIAAPVFADDDAPPVIYPTLPASTQTEAGLIPKGWIVETRNEADLNGDGTADLALVLHMTDQHNLLHPQDESSFDANPRLLVIAFGVPGTETYTVALSNHTLIPRWTDPSVQDAFTGAKIIKGTLKVSLTFITTMGSDDVSTRDYLFRYRDGCFHLIGYDVEDTTRSPGGSFTDRSYNFLTGKIKQTKGSNGDEGADDKTVWTHMKNARSICLDEVGEGDAFEP